MEMSDLLFICRGLLLVILLIRRRDREPLKFMGHDLKQFKSLEGLCICIVIVNDVKIL